MALIGVRGLTVRYSQNIVLRELEHEFPDARVTALVGLSGCGKTTLLNAIAGLVKDFEGSITVGTRTLTASSPVWPFDRFGYVVQGGGLFPHLTVRENIGLRDLGVRPPSGARLTELQDIARVSRAWFDRYPKELSGGQQQRVGLARALYHNPDVLLMDEPLGALDPLLRKELQMSLKDLFISLRKTVILVTHDLREAEMLGDSIAVMNRGRIEQVDTGEGLRRAPKTDFVRRFVEAF
jgi:osmoprotectant transport system ATP-binding protein